MTPTKLQEAIERAWQSLMIGYADKPSDRLIGKYDLDIILKAASEAEALRERVKELEVGLALVDPVYSRRQLEDRYKQLRALCDQMAGALKTAVEFLGNYTHPDIEEALTAWQKMNTTTKGE